VFRCSGRQGQAGFDGRASSDDSPAVPEHLNT
jgi:hypothetical protein